ncbi:MAG: phage tail protein, partial [Burkholderiales bacterium]|nr:phage tail protein [Burkholderiales bacterium]
MSVVQAGAINTTALIVPDIYVQIMPPSVAYLNGLPTNILGIVGTATWGPVNSPTVVASMADYANKFGALQARKYDAGTAVAAAVLQGACNMRIVRVTDGTDTAATATLGTNGLTVTAKYSGSLGNGIQVTLAAGTAANTTKVIVAFPGQTPEVFDNVAGTGNALWVALAAAINNGTSTLRGPSQFVVASAGAGTTAPTLGATPLAGGTDGAAGVTGTTLVGQDIVPRQGMYALRNTGTSIAMLADCDASATWSLQLAYGLSEGTYMIMTGPAGDTIANATATKATAGIDSYAAKLLFGDWVYFNDTVNGQIRVISPQGFVAGRLANMSPEQSSLNKPLYGIVGTQKSYANQCYSAAELTLLGQAGIDVITNPSPGGSYYSARFGHNSSSNAVINGDNYTRLTNYIAYSLNAGMGQYVGQLHTPQRRREAASTISSFLANMAQQNMIGDAGGGAAFSVVANDSNNPPSRVALGYLQIDVKVKYFSIV